MPFLKLPLRDLCRRANFQLRAHCTQTSSSIFNSLHLNFAGVFLGTQLATPNASKHSFMNMKLCM